MSEVCRFRRGLVLALALVALECAVAAGAAANSGPPTNLPPAIAQYIETQPTAGGPKTLQGQLALPEPAPATTSASTSSSPPTEKKSSSKPAGKKAKKKHSVDKQAGGSTGHAAQQQSTQRLAQPASRSTLAAAVGGGGGLGAYLLAAALGSVALVLLARIGLRRRS